jgi:hypothetical protein
MQWHCPSAQGKGKAAMGFAKQGPSVSRQGVSQQGQSKAGRRYAWQWHGREERSKGAAMAVRSESLHRTLNQPEEREDDGDDL